MGFKYGDNVIFKDDRGEHPAVYIGTDDPRRTCDNLIMFNDPPEGYGWSVDTKYFGNRNPIIRNRVNLFEHFKNLWWASSDEIELVN